jgi:glycerophosphoryl diester phosphodiesterase
MLRIGHRGAAALAPENTVAAMRAAIGAGVDMVEFDGYERETLAVCDAAGAADRAAFAWTVNTRAGIQRMAALGCDGVITDDPRLFHEE